ncbi:hypothetical protein [Herbidospora galbida]|uniref:hypothetical protein n=1 Tax=Herbidospora galbida TaxID=2575442 RepID=UPI001BAED7A0|nr:hypothetical protein [Herbidospora galbida]
MAMPRKGSRLITVADTVYRWRVRHRPTYCEGLAWSPLSFSVEHATRPRSALKVTLPCARPDNWLGEKTMTLRPALVASVIRRALGRGWTPDAGAGAVFLDITEDELPELLGEPPEYVLPFLRGGI